MEPIGFDYRPMFRPYFGVSDMSDSAREQAIAQVASIRQMVAALSVDYDRLEELRELGSTPKFTAMLNIPGFLPDAEPVDFDDADDALEYLRELAKSSIEDDESLSQEDYEELCSDIDCWSAIENGEFGITFRDYHYSVVKDGNMLTEDEADELAELEDAAGECSSEDDAVERIDQDPLEICVRSGWHQIGEDMVPEEFLILLCTGGPAVRIRGELDQYGSPCRVWIEYQDWGTPWTELVGLGYAYDDLLTYAQRLVSLDC